MYHRPVQLLHFLPDIYRSLSLLQYPISAFLRIRTFLICIGKQTALGVSSKRLHIFHTSCTHLSIKLSRYTYRLTPVFWIKSTSDLSVQKAHKPLPSAMNGVVKIMCFTRMTSLEFQFIRSILADKLK